MSEFTRSREEFPRLGEEEPLKNRRRVVLMAFYYSFWTVLLSAFVVIALYNIILRDDFGFLLMLFIGLFVGLLTGHQASQYLRDVGARPVVYEGDVLRKWNKGNLLIVLFPSYYIMVDRRVFCVRREEYALLLEDDLVRVTCYPHSLTVERLELYDVSEKQFVPAAGGAAL